ncbi:MAG: hypothetical protein DCC71_20410 [Proteobacteria bacterium]|nr:MAG: hypothetical protein DCC71_20410 [Pseudomonadota bacterium]
MRIRAGARSRRRARVARAAVAAALVAALGCAGERGPREAGPVVPSTARELAALAYVYAYPLVLFDALRKQQADALGAHNRLVARTTTFTPFTHDPGEPDADSVSSIAFLDLRSGPLVLSVPDSGKRFTRIELLDAYTNVFASLGQRTRGNGAAQYAIVGPGGSAPAGLTEVRSPTAFALLQGQIAAQGERDVPAASGLMQQWSLTPLAAYAQGQRQTAVERPRGLPATDPPVTLVESMPPEKYFEQAAKLMQLNPPAPGDAPLTKKFATIGLDASRGRFDPKKAKGGILAAAWNDGRAKIRAAQPTQKSDGGWTFSPATGSWGYDYLSRAAAARLAIGGKLAADAIEAVARADSEGRRLEGAHRYVVEFAKAPPVHAFWSLTLLDEQGRMVDNVLNRYAVRGDRLRKQGDRTVVHVSFAPPEDDDARANWLPAPRGPFQLVLRLYGPREAALTGDWKPPAVERAD